MANFRGVPQEDIVASLRQALNFLWKLQVGPWTSGEIAERLASDKLCSDLERAPDAREFADTLKYSNTAEFLRSVYPLLDHHAKRDTDGIGRKVYEDLARWGGFVHNKKLETTPAFEEREIYLTLEYAKMIIAEGPEIPAKMQAKIDKHIEDMRSMHFEGEVRDDNRVAQDIQDMIFNVRNGDMKTATEIFMENGSGTRMILSGALFDASGMGDLPSLQVKTPFHRYGILLDPTKGPFQDPEVVNDLRTKMTAALEPFIETGDAMMMGVGRVTRDPRSIGAAFFATDVSAAEAVANAIPDVHVVGWDGIALQRTDVPVYKTVTPKKFKL